MTYSAIYLKHERHSLSLRRSQSGTDINLRISSVLLFGYCLGLHGRIKIRFIRPCRTGLLERILNILGAFFNSLGASFDPFTDTLVEVSPGALICNPGQP